MINFLYEFWTFSIYSTKSFSLTAGHLITGILVLVVGIIVSSLIKKLIDKKLSNLALTNETEVVVIKKIAYYTSLIIFIYFALSILDIPLSTLSFLVGGIGIGLGFGLKGYISNFISGLVIIIERPFKIQDVVDIKGNIGRIVDISLRSTRIHTEENIDIILPNNVVLESAIENWTKDDNTVLTFIPIQLDYDVDIEKATKLMKTAASNVKGILKKPEPFVLFNEHGAYSLNFKVYFAVKIKNKLERWTYESEVNYSLNKILRENNISIAYPTTNINLNKQIN
jgi:potassium-dependent mechanosensitive channel